MAGSSPTGQEIMAHIQALPLDQREKLIAEILKHFKDVDNEDALTNLKLEEERRKAIEQRQRESQDRKDSYGIPEWTD